MFKKGKINVIKTLRWNAEGFSVTRVLKGTNGLVRAAVSVGLCESV